MNVRKLTISPRHNWCPRCVFLGLIPMIYHVLRAKNLHRQTSHPRKKHKDLRHRTLCLTFSSLSTFHQATLNSRTYLHSTRRNYAPQFHGTQRQTQEASRAGRCWRGGRIGARNLGSKGHQQGHGEERRYSSVRALGDTSIHSRAHSIVQLLFQMF